VREVCPDALVVTQEGRGKGNAIKHGLRLATGDIVVTMDADGSMSMSDVAPMVDRLIAGCDFVKGSRALPGAGSDDFTRIRYFGNWLLTKVANAIYGSDYTDITYGFNAYWRNVMVNADRLSDGFQFEIQAAIRAARAGLTTSEVACHEHARIGGASKLNPLKDGWFILKVILGEAKPRRRVEFRAVADLHLRAERRVTRLGCACH
jgi:glycosyltransferase involved in cell wall biosynthesis